MKYELAKKLKEAGFPQSHPSCAIAYNADGRTTIDFSGYPDVSDWGVVRVPPLSELIEACGDKFESLTKQSGDWFADAKGEWVIRSDNYADPLVTVGATPEEAVANLYLALNEK